MGFDLSFSTPSSVQSDLKLMKVLAEMQVAYKDAIMQICCLLDSFNSYFC